METEAPKVETEHTPYQKFVKFCNDHFKRLEFTLDIFLIPLIVSKISKLLNVKNSFLHVSLFVSIYQLFFVKYVFLFAFSFFPLYLISTSLKTVVFAQVANFVYFFFSTISNSKLKTPEICILSQIITTFVYCVNYVYEIDFILTFLYTIGFFLSSFLITFSTALFVSKRIPVAAILSQIPAYIMWEWVGRKKDGITPLKWCFRQIIDNFPLILLWVALSSAFLFPIFLIIYFKKDNFRVSSLRKLIHFLLSSIIISSVYFDRTEFVLLALMAVLSLFVVSEVVRNLKIPFFAKIFKSIDFFYNERDSDDFLFVHIFLLIGMSVPLVVHEVLKKDDLLGKWVLGLAGVYAVGLSDSLASILGGAFGKRPFPFSTKTLIGSGVFFATLFSCLSVASYLSCDSIRLFRLFKIAFLSTLYEAYTGSLDNLTVPLVSTLLLLHYY